MIAAGRARTPQGSTFPCGREPMAGQAGRPRKAGPYGRIYSPWADAWDRAGLSGLQRAVMERLCMRLEFDGDGRALASFDSAALAEARGVSLSAIEKAAARLRGLGFLKVRDKAHRGACVVHEVMPGVPWPDAKGGARRKPKGREAWDTGNLEVPDFDPEEV